MMSGKMKTKFSWLPLFDNNGNNIKSTSPSPASAKATPQVTGKTSLGSAPASPAASGTSTVSATVKVSTTCKMKTVATRSSSSVMVARPNTLNVNRNGQNAETKAFIGDALNAWRTKARGNVVPAERLQELFHELQFNPSEKQICEMLQTAKAFARKGGRQLNGLTFGEFCVLAADLKRFRTCNFSSANDSKIFNSLSFSPDNSSSSSLSSNSTCSSSLRTTVVPNKIEPCSISFSTNSSKDDLVPSGGTTPSDGSTAATTPSDVNAPEVFLGGSCNPTTWRADVAIPTLQSLGISFYNPQVSDWTPDLIELEHRAKEKARVLFFVMDSETRASAGAIEAAHIAGQNSRQLVLVLHPYRSDQSILNEPISPQEFLDLSRNQQLLRELVTRRGLPVLDNIPSGLQRTKQILAGVRDPPMNIASILTRVRNAFERVVNSLDDELNLQQCQQALSFLGYASNLLSLDNLKVIVATLRDSLEMNSLASTSSTSSTTNKSSRKEIRINVDEFCVLAAYLSVLQQEIHESGCISPIKGTNLPPPPIFLTNMQEGIHNNRNGDETVMITASLSKQIFRTSSCTSVPDDRVNGDFYRSRDSGTSSPQPIEPVKPRFSYVGKRSKISLNVEFMEIGETGGEESDSNDSVFSSGSSINSNFCDSSSAFAAQFRDVYLGGSCFLRTKWRQDYAIPYLTGKGITYHLPMLHESLLPSQLSVCGVDPSVVAAVTATASSSSIVSEGADSGNASDKAIDESINAKNNQKTRSRRKQLGRILGCGSGSNVHMQMERDDSHDDENLLSIRPNLFNSELLESSRVLLFVITNETRSLAPMTLAAHCIGLMYNVVLCVQMLPEFCIIGNDRLTPAAIKDYNRGRSYLIDLAKRQGVPVFNDLKSALECTVEKVEKVKACNSRNSV